VGKAATPIHHGIARIGHPGSDNDRISTILKFIVVFDAPGANSNALTFSCRTIIVYLSAMAHVGIP